jgi:hypothetical protein
MAPDDDLRNAYNALSEHVICHREGSLQRGVLGDDL